MDKPSRTLTRNLAALTQARKKRPTRALTSRPGMAQEEVAARMWAVIVALRGPA